MRFPRVAASLVAILATLSADRAGAEDQAPDTQSQPAALTLDFEKVMALSAQAPQLRVADLRVAEARAERVAAGVYPTSNPLVSTEIGPQLNDDVLGPFVSIALTQTFELGRRVRAREAAVDANVETASAQADLLALDIAYAAAIAYLDALYARRRITLAAENAAIAKRAVEAAVRRQQAGDATELEVNVARGTHARARSDELSWQALHEDALTRLRALLGLDPLVPIDIQGNLEMSLLSNRSGLATLLPTRANLRALHGDLAGADAELALGESLAAPDLTIGIQYELSGLNQQTVMGLFSITLPFFEHGQGSRARARARKDRAEAEIATETAIGLTRIAGSLAIVERREAAVHAFDEHGGRTSFEENVRLATRAYEAGEASLVELLAVRRELVETEIVRLENVLALRKSEIDARFAAGTLPGK